MPCCHGLSVGTLVQVADDQQTQPVDLAVDFDQTVGVHHVKPWTDRARLDQQLNAVPVSDESAEPFPCRQILRTSDPVNPESVFAENFAFSWPGANPLDRRARLGTLVQSLLDSGVSTDTSASQAPL